jgi:hypothetical protein
MRHSTLVLVVALAAAIFAGCGSSRPAGQQVAAPAGGNVNQQAPSKSAGKSKSKAQPTASKASCDKRKLANGVSVKLANTGSKFLVTVCNLSNKSISKLLLYVHADPAGSPTIAPLKATGSSDVAQGGADLDAGRRMLVDHLNPGASAYMELDYPDSVVTQECVVTAGTIVLKDGADSTQWQGWSRFFKNGSHTDKPLNNAA